MANAIIEGRQGESIDSDVAEEMVNEDVEPESIEEVVEATEEVKE